MIMSKKTLIVIVIFLSLGLVRIIQPEEKSFVHKLLDVFLLSPQPLTQCQKDQNQCPFSISMSLEYEESEEGFYWQENRSRLNGLHFLKRMFLWEGLRENLKSHPKLSKQVLSELFCTKRVDKSLLASPGALKQITYLVRNHREDIGVHAECE